METDRKAFLDLIEADPLDEVARGVYADWLEERGEDDEAARQRRYVPSYRWMLDFAKKHHQYGQYHDWEFEERTGRMRGFGGGEETYDYAEEYGGQTPQETAEKYYREFLEFLKGHRRGGERWFGFDLPYEFTEYSDEMWGYFEVLTGLPAPQGAYRTKAPPMACAC